MIRKSTVVAAVSAIVLAIAGCGGATEAPPAVPAGAVPPPPGLLTPGTLTIGTNFQYPPYEYMDDQQKMAGLDYEFGKMLAATLGLHPKFIALKHDSLIPAVQTRKVDVAISWIFVSDERAKSMDFVDYAKSGYGLLVKSGSNRQLTSPADLCGLTIGAGLTTPIAAQAGPDGELTKQCAGKAPVTIRPYGESQPLISDLAAGRLDAAVGDIAAMLYFSQSIPTLKGQLQSGLPEGAMYFPTPIGIGIRKGASNIEKSVQAAVDHLVKTGELATLLATEKVGLPDRKLFDSVVGGGALPLFDSGQ